MCPKDEEPPSEGRLLPFPGEDGEVPGTGAPPATNGPSVEQIHDELLRAVRSYCPAWLADEAEDLTQDAMIRILPMLEEGRELKSSFFWKTAYHLVIDRLRRERHRATASLESKEDTLREPPGGDHPTPEILVVNREIGKAIRDCLQQTVLPRRRVLVLYLIGHTYPEIAGIVEDSRDEKARKRVENRVLRGLQNLQDCLRSKGYGPGTAGEGAAK